jgi:hypothetical protein
MVCDIPVVRLSQFLDDMYTYVLSSITTDQNKGRKAVKARTEESFVRAIFECMTYCDFCRWECGSAAVPELEPPLTVHELLSLSRKLTKEEAVGVRIHATRGW